MKQPIPPSLRTYAAVPFSFSRIFVSTKKTFSVDCPRPSPRKISPLSVHHEQMAVPDLSSRLLAVNQCCIVSVYLFLLLLLLRAYSVILLLLLLFFPSLVHVTFCLFIYFFSLSLFPSRISQSQLQSASEIAVQLRAHGPNSGAALDTREHSRVRRRPEQRDTDGPRHGRRVRRFSDGVLRGAGR